MSNRHDDDAIDLQFVGGQARQAAQRRLARTEVVDQDASAGDPDSSEHADLGAQRLVGLVDARPGLAGVGVESR